MFTKVQIGDCILYKGDCYDVLRSDEIMDGVVTLVHTDPPYLIHSEVQKSKMYVDKGINNQQVKLINAGISDSYDMSIFKEFKRVCKCPNYQIWCSKKQFIEYLIYADRNRYNWQDVMLYRNNALPNVNGKYQDKDYLVHMWKGRKITGTYHQKMTDYHWDIGCKKEYNHPTLKPLEPTRNLICIGSDEGDYVLDPFMGSGTTAIACLELGRKFIGIEMSDEYFNMAVERIKKWYNCNMGE